MSAVKKIVTVPKNGQISIGKNFAGQMVYVEELGDGRILITKGNFIPDNLQVFYTEEANKKLDAFNSFLLKEQTGEKTSEEVFAEIEKSR